MGDRVVATQGSGGVLVWADAAVQPRFAPGPKTAALVAVLTRFVGYCAANVANVMCGFMAVPRAIVGTAWGLVELVVAAEPSRRMCAETRRRRSPCIEPTRRLTPGGEHASRRHVGVWAA
jgi:hypothetical protein